MEIQVESHGRQFNLTVENTEVTKVQLILQPGQFVYNRTVYHKGQFTGMVPYVKQIVADAYIQHPAAFV